jgi:hypothetical protein
MSHASRRCTKARNPHRVKVACSQILRERVKCPACVSLSALLRNSCQIRRLHAASSYDDTGSTTLPACIHDCDLRTVRIFEFGSASSACGFIWYYVIVMLVPFVYPRLPWRTNRCVKCPRTVPRACHCQDRPKRYDLWFREYHTLFSMHFSDLS